MSNVNELCYCYSYKILKIDRPCPTERRSKTNDFNLYPPSRFNPPKMSISPLFTSSFWIQPMACTTHLFPKFASKALNTNSKGKIDSKVSALWMECFNDLLLKIQSISRTNQQQTVVIPWEEGIQSEDGRILDCWLSTNISFSDRLGSTWCGTLTIFDYVTGSERMSEQAGNVGSNWHSKAGRHHPRRSTTKVSRRHYEPQPTR